MLSRESRASNQIIGVFCSIFLILLIIATIACLVSVFFFNHWIGGGRIIFVMISIVFAIFICIFFSEYTNYPRNRISLLIIALLLIGHFSLAGLTVSLSLDAFDVSSGKLEKLKSGFRWENPYTQTSVLTAKPETETEVTSILYPDKVLKIRYSPRYKIGTPAKILLDEGYIGTADLLNNGKAALGRCNQLAAQKALLIAGFTKKDLSNPQLKKKMQKAYFEAIKQEIRNSIPVPMELPKNAKIKISVVSPSEE